MKILAMIQGALGDGIMALWGLRAVAGHTGARLTLICSPNLGSLARDLGLAQSVFPVLSPEMTSLYGPAPSPWVRGQLQNHDVVLVFSFSRDLFRAVQSLAPKAVKIPPRPGPGETIHVLDFILQHLHKAGLTACPSLDEHKGLSSAFDLYSTHEGKFDPQVLMHPGSGSHRKNWPLENYVALYHVIKGKGLSVKCVLGPEDHALDEHLSKTLPAAKILKPETLLDFKDCLLGCQVYLGNDSGATHLSALLGVPTVVIFGPSDPVRWRPVGPIVRVLHPLLACKSCFETQTENCRIPPCLLNTLPVDVLAVVEDMLDF